MTDSAQRQIPVREKMAVALYQLASRVHWPAREDALRQALAHLGLRGQRLVDIGCGPGLLAKAARDLGFAYIGIDPDRAAIEYARQKYTSEGIQFAVADASDVTDFVHAGDVAILNGVSHHLSDRELSLVLSSLKPCSGIFILDHQLDQATSRLNRFLQQKDRGRFVRPSTAFDSLPGYRTSYHVIFSIPSKSLPAWRYFCNFYVPVKSHT
jgi:2-polyprenyl-3-methyl-5-hydroxy-6-metoxy-1,4-benzoquinol methylase